MRGPPQFLKKTKLREYMGQMKIFHVGAHQFRESLRELLRDLWLSYCSSCETLSEGSKGGWRKEGVGAKKPFKGRRFTPLCVPFFLCPLRSLGEWGHISGELLGSFWGFVCRQPPPANPFSKPPREAIPRMERRIPRISFGIPSSV